MSIVSRILAAAGLTRADVPVEIPEPLPMPEPVEVLPFEVRRLDEDAKQRYRNAMAAGYGEPFAIMVACQIAPGTMGVDRTFQEGHLDGNWMDRLPKRQAQRLLRDAKRAGINTAGRFYMSGIADKRGGGDPEAWVSSRDDVLRVAKKRRLQLRGTINYEPPEGAPVKRVDMAPRLVKELTKKEMAANPGMKRRDAVEAVKKRHALKRKL